MDFIFLLSESFQSLRTNPLRSGLSVLGVVVGVASVVAVMSIGLGAEAQVQKILTSLGAQNLHIVARELSSDEWKQISKQSLGLSYRDVALATELFPDAKITPLSKWKIQDVNMPTSGQPLDLIGVESHFFEVLSPSLKAGRRLTSFEEKQGFPLILVGERWAERWFGNDLSNALQKEIRIDRMWFRIIGVLGSSEEVTTDKTGKAPPPESPQGSSAATTASGTGSPFLDFGNLLVTSKGAAELRLKQLARIAPVQRIVVKLPAEKNALQSKEILERNLDKLHRKRQILDVFAAEDVIRQRRNTSRIFSYFLVAIATISLIVGGIGIANVMLASIVERIREVGLRRALGAKRKHIMAQFLAESLCVSGLGGILGGLLGLTASVVTAHITGWEIVFPWWILGVAVLISMVVGVLAGLYPATSASRISPVEALQGRA